MRELISFVNEIVSDIFEGFRLGHMSQQSMAEAKIGIGKIKKLRQIWAHFQKKHLIWSKQACKQKYY